MALNTSSTGHEAKIMLELITGEALFHGMAAHYHEMSLPARIVLMGILMLGLALLVMTLVSLGSYVAGGAPFVSTSKRLTRAIVSIADIQPGETVYDLGCGDGRFLIEANKFYGAKAVGIEISPVICLLARVTAWIQDADVALHCANLKTVDFSNADVIFCYLVPDVLEFLAGRFHELKPGSRIISRRFEIPGHEPVRRVTLRKGFGTEIIYVYQI